MATGIVLEFEFGTNFAAFSTTVGELLGGPLAAVGPFWDGNEVWLIVFGGAMFAAFPEVYANLFSRHYLLLFAILAALNLMTIVLVVLLPIVLVYFGVLYSVFNGSVEAGEGY